jgi:hypothetical protein
MSADGGRGTEPSSSRTSKPAERAFVVKFDPLTKPHGRLRGRAEVVASGEGTQFRSLRQLVGFMVGILRRPPDRETP